MAAALEGRPSVGSDELVVQLMTVREDRAVHVTLLSRAEVEVVGTGHVLLALAGRTTPTNLLRERHGSLVVVEGTTCTTIGLTPVADLVHEGMTGVVAAVVEVREDSLGIPLRPLGFTVPADLPGVERWETSAQLLGRLADLLPSRDDR